MRRRALLVREVESELEAEVEVRLRTRGAQPGERFERSVVWVASEIAALLDAGTRVALRTDDGRLDAVSGERLRGLALDDAGIADWFRHWVALEFTALETRLAREPETGRFCHGDGPTLADLCLAPQVINNARFDCDMSPYPTIRRIHEACMELEAFQKAHPMEQPDAEG